MEKQECTSNGRRDTTFKLALSNWTAYPENRRKFYAVLHSLVEHSRQQDDYEPDPEPRPLGMSEHISLHVAWNGSQWTLSDFIALLVTRHHHPTSPPSGATDNETREANLVALDAYSDSECDELARFCFFLALYVDTRAMRVCCKYNNILESLELDCPKPHQILNLRSGLADVLGYYTAVGPAKRWSWAKCRDALVNLIGTGRTQMPDLASSNEPTSYFPLVTDMTVQMGAYAYAIGPPRAF